MKKLLLTGAVLLSSFLAVNAQTTIFEENWDGTGPGVAGWTLYNVDGFTPAEDPLSVLVTDAWTVLSLSDIQTALEAPTYEYPEAATGMADNVIASNSFYEPVGVANDWLVSPAITISPAATVATLTFAANSMGNDTFLEDYEVNISTTTNEMASFTQLLNVPNESNEGNYRTVSLNDYIGETIYLAFRNKGSDQYVMLLDNIKVTSDVVAGVNDNLASKLSVYPNPANNVVNVVNSENILVSGITVADINGRTVKNNKFDGVANTQINISDLASGVYMMTISSDKGSTTKKIVKN